MKNVAILVAIAVNEDGYREVLGAAEGMKRGQVQLGKAFPVAAQPYSGRGGGWRQVPLALEAVGEVFPEAKYQRCTVHFYRNVFSVTPRSKVKLVAKMLERSAGKARKPPGSKKLWWSNCAL